LVSWGRKSWCPYRDKLGHQIWCPGDTNSFYSVEELPIQTICKIGITLGTKTKVR